MSEKVAFVWRLALGTDRQMSLNYQQVLAKFCRSQFPTKGLSSRLILSTLWSGLYFCDLYMMQRIGDSKDLEGNQSIRF